MDTLRPGSFPLKGQTTVHQAIVSTGGATHVAALGHIRLHGTVAAGQVLRLDCQYVDTGSVWLDLRILARTVHKVLGRRTGW